MEQFKLFRAFKSVLNYRGRRISSIFHGSKYFLFHSSSLYECISSLALRRELTVQWVWYTCCFKIDGVFKLLFHSRYPCDMNMEWQFSLTRFCSYHFHSNINSFKYETQEKVWKFFHPHSLMISVFFSSVVYVSSKSWGVEWE